MSWGSCSTKVSSHGPKGDAHDELQEKFHAGLVKAAGAGQISNAQAALALHLSPRQVQRLKGRYRAEGAAGLRHRIRGRPSTRGLPAAVREQMRALLQTTYWDVNDCHATEQLREVHGLHVITGHKTRSVFDRYHIVSPGDLREAALRLHEHSSGPSRADSVDGRHATHNF